jgi:hypothetical protein
VSKINLDKTKGLYIGTWYASWIWHSRWWYMEINCRKNEKLYTCLETSKLDIWG